MEVKEKSERQKLHTSFKKQWWAENKKNYTKINAKGKIVCDVPACSRACAAAWVEQNGYSNQTVSRFVPVYGENDKRKEDKIVDIREELKRNEKLQSDIEENRKKIANMMIDPNTTIKLLPRPPLKERPRA